MTRHHLPLQPTRDGAHFERLSRSNVVRFDTSLGPHRKRPGVDWIVVLAIAASFVLAFAVGVVVIAFALFIWRLVHGVSI